MNKQLLLTLTTCVLSLNQSSYTMNTSIAQNCIDAKKGMTQDQVYWRLMIACLKKHPQETVTYEQQQLDCLSYSEQVQACQAYSLLATQREGPGQEQRNAAHAKVYSLSHAIKTFILKDKLFRDEIQHLEGLQSKQHNLEKVTQKDHDIEVEHKEHDIIKLVTSIMVDQLVFHGHRVKAIDKIR